MVTVAATQMACGWDRDANIARAEKLIREAAAPRRPGDPDPGAVRDAVLLQGSLAEHLELARPLDAHPAVEHFRAVARQLGVVLPISVFERANNAFYNSVAIVDADGRCSAVTASRIFPRVRATTRSSTSRRATPVSRCSTAPMPSSGLGSAGISGFRRRRGPWRCWARTCCSIPPPSALNRRIEHRLERALAAHHAGSCRGQHHAGGGFESHRHGAWRQVHHDFYGSSFIASPTGEKLAEADRESETMLTAAFDLDEVRRYRHSWGVFRDRRPELYHPLLSLDGRG